MEFTEEGIVVEKSPNALDELVLDVVELLEDASIEYAVVSGYVAVLFGRARATEDIDVIVERFDEATADELSTSLENGGFWGTAMPLDAMYDTLSEDLPVRIAEEGQRVPNVELKFASDEYDRISLANTTTVQFSNASLRIGTLEFQIAFKLAMGAQKDFEDALHLYEVTGPMLNTSTLQSYVETLEVEDEYDRLRSGGEAGT